MSTEYEIHLDGIHASAVPLAVLRDLADLLVEGSARAARLAAEGRSTARGTAPVWLSESSDVRLARLREGSLVLDVTARSLDDIAPGVFSVAAGETALDLAANSPRRDLSRTTDPPE